MMINPKPDAREGEARLPLSYRVLQAIWARRQAVVRAIHATGSGLSWLYHRFPLPQRVRDIVTELTYHGIEHFIVQSEGYQTWLQRRSGLSRLHGLFRPEREEAAPEPLPAPTQAAWDALAVPSWPQAATLAVIIPVYKGYAETLRCLYSVLNSHSETPFHLLVINDASPEAALTDALRALSQRFGFELIEHARNQGFVRSVNAGMAHHGDKDVILLNADTEVYDGWADRLYRALYAREDIASVTPFSNQAELCSYPAAFRANPQPLEIDYAALDALAACCFDDYPELPTAVGFCMAIRRRALEETGAFDAQLFGRGYGEENDWCLRAAAHGWRHVMAPNVFVWHRGSVSFAAQKQRELRRSLRRLNRRHPHYRRLVRAFRQSDPLLAYRRRLDLARLKQALAGRPAMLMISHDAGGGTERHITDMSRWLQAEGVSVLRLSPDAARQTHLRLWHPAIAQTPNLTFSFEDEADALIAALRELGVAHVHLHHLSGFPAGMALWVPRCARALDCAFDVTLHDYYLACPSINLLLEADYMQDEPDLAASQAWARRHPSPAGRMPVWLWREQHGRLLEQARRVFAPSEDAAQRIGRYFPQIDVTLREHPEDALHITPPGRTHRPGEALNVAVIGHLVRHKGYDVVLKLAQDAAARELPILFHLFGETERPGPLRKSGQVMLHGAYREDEIGALLQAHRCHAALIPSVWPETYSYTLSLALHHRLFPVCFDLGAPAQRLREAGWGEILPREWILQPQRVNDRLLGLTIGAPPSACALITERRARYPSIVTDYYALPPEALTALTVVTDSPRPAAQG